MTYTAKTITKPIEHKRTMNFSSLLNKVNKDYYQNLARVKLSELHRDFILALNKMLEKEETDDEPLEYYSELIENFEYVEKKIKISTKEEFELLEHLINARYIFLDIAVKNLDFDVWTNVSIIFKEDLEFKNLI